MAINLDAQKTDAPEDRVELFTLNDKVYTIPSKPRINLSLKYLKLARTEGTEAAASFLLEALLGEEAYDALMDYDDLTQDQLQEIMKAAQKAAVGELEAPN